MLIVPKAKVMYPMSLEREYARELVRYTKGVTAICYEYLPLMVDEALANGITADRMDNWITDVTEKIRETIDSKLRITDKISAMFNKVKGYAQRQQEKIYRSIFGGTPARPSSRQYEVIKQIWASQNLTLIRSIDNRTLEAIHYALSRNVIRTVDREMLVSELTQTIKHMANVNEKRAALIACDQVGKLNSQLAQYEQMNQGIKQYIWQSMHDDRVRPRHRAPYRDGNTYNWDDPPPGGHPGWPIRCRCVAKPVYDTEKIGLQPKRGSYESARENAIIRDKLKRVMEKYNIEGELAYPAPKINISKFGFDDNHINGDRKHGVTENEARGFAQNANFAIYRRNEKYINLYSKDGATYLMPGKKLIRTSIKERQYAKGYREMLEVIENATKKR